MSESEAAKVAGRLQKRDVEATWHDAVNEAIDLLHATIANWPADKEPPLHELADADQVAHEIESLRQQLADAQYNAEAFRARAESASSANQAWMERVEELEQRLAAEHEAAAELERELDTVTEQLRDAHNDLERANERLFGLESNNDHADCYVAREVPWSDVAAGMMTIARDGTPWMVVGWESPAVLIRNGTEQFVKYPKPGETVRVLVPYVTPEQAEALVASELGGRA